MRGVFFRYCCSSFSNQLIIALQQGSIYILLYIYIIILYIYIYIIILYIIYIYIRYIYIFHPGRDIGYMSPRFHSSIPLYPWVKL